MAGFFIIDLCKASPQHNVATAMLHAVDATLMIMCSVTKAQIWSKLQICDIVSRFKSRFLFAALS